MIARSAVTHRFYATVRLFIDKGLYRMACRHRDLQSGGRAILLSVRTIKSAGIRLRVSTRILEFGRVNGNGMFRPEMKPFLILVSDGRGRRGDQFYEQTTGCERRNDE